jgi:hypothetical protein
MVFTFRRNVLWVLFLESGRRQRPANFQQPAEPTVHLFGTRDGVVSMVISINGHKLESSNAQVQAGSPALGRVGRLWPTLILKTIV